MPEFLRDRRGDLETAWLSDDHTAADRSRALHVLRGCVLIVRHPYQSDPYSGAGNCWCGRDQGGKLHDVVVMGDGEGVPDATR